MTDTSLQGPQMKTTKTQYFLWKKDNINDVIIYSPSKVNPDCIPYYNKNNFSTNFYKFTFKSLAALEDALKRNNYNFICSLLLPSDHTNEDLTVYYTTIKKKFSL